MCTFLANVAFNKATNGQTDIKYEMWKTLTSVSLLKIIGEKLPPSRRSSLENQCVKLKKIKHKNCVSQVLSLLFERPELGVMETVDRENWRQIQDRQLIEQVVNDVLNTHPKVVSGMGTTTSKTAAC